MLSSSCLLSARAGFGRKKAASDELCMKSKKPHAFLPSIFLQLPTPSRMSTLKEIYKTLFGGEKVNIEVSSWREFENLRIQLQKEHQTPVALDMTSDSLCASYDRETSIASYWLGKSRRSVAKQWKLIRDDGQDQC